MEASTRVIMAESRDHVATSWSSGPSGRRKRPPRVHVISGHCTRETLGGDRGGSRQISRQAVRVAQRHARGLRIDVFTPRLS